MRKFCSVHTHSTLCDGRSTLAEMAAAAFEAGAVSFGASGHSHTEIPWDRGCVLPADPAAYRAEVLRLREEYAGRMDVLLGIEQDSLTDQPVPDWADYWIGSVHNLRRPGGFASVDYSPEKLEEDCRTLFQGDFLEMAAAYYAEAAAMAARRPTILGHIDLVTKFNEGGVLFDESDPRYRAAALAALHAADPAATLLEINTGAMSRGYRSAPYPAPALLRAMRERNIPICITGDSHNVAALLHAFPQAAELARSCGYREQMALTRRGFEPAAL